MTFVGTLSRTQSRLQRRVFAAVLRQSITELRADGAGEGHRAERGHGVRDRGGTDGAVTRQGMWPCG